MLFFLLFRISISLYTLCNYMKLDMLINISIIYKNDRQQYTWRSENKLRQPVVMPVICATPSKNIPCWPMCELSSLFVSILFFFRPLAGEYPQNPKLGLENNLKGIFMKNFQIHRFGRYVDQ